MNVAYSKNDFSYKINLMVQDSGRKQRMTFDTGAGSTILGMNILVKEGLLTNEQDRAVFNLFNICNVRPKIFLSATNTRMSAFPCSISDVNISGLSLKIFYFYLFIGSDNPDVAILGNDFIRYCSLTKNIDSDIEVTDFDFNAYEKNFIETCSSDVILPINRIYDEFERMESTKNIAAAFRYLITHPKTGK